MPQDSTERKEGVLVKANTAPVERRVAYKYALEGAKQEFDELLPQLKTLELRARSLRYAMRGLSEILGEELDDQYQFFQPRPVEHGSLAGRNNPGHPRHNPHDRKR